MITNDLVIDLLLAERLADYDRLMQHAAEAGMYEEMLEAIREAYCLGKGCRHG